MDNCSNKKKLLNMFLTKWTLKIETIDIILKTIVYLFGYLHLNDFFLFFVLLEFVIRDIILIMLVLVSYNLRKNKFQI